MLIGKKSYFLQYHNALYHIRSDCIHCKNESIFRKNFFFFKVTLVDQHLMLPMLQCEVCLYLDRR